MEYDGFEVRVIDYEKGKGLFATRPYKEGDIILEEKPIVCCQFLWNLEYGYLACDNCMRPLETAEENARRLTSNEDLVLPHPECCETVKNTITECSACGTKYCSVECKDEAMQRYHATLCMQTREEDEAHPLTQLKETWKQMHYPPETVTIMLLARMIALVKQSSNKDEILSTFFQFCHSSVRETHEISHNFMGAEFVEQLDVLRPMVQQALDNEYTYHWFTPEGFRGLWASIGTNGQGIGTSAFSRWVKNVSALDLPTPERFQVDKLIVRIYENMEDVVGSFLNNEGSGLYVLQSSVNHSCTPNALVQFPYSNNVLVLRATSDIQQGDEICISYLDECYLERSRHSRHKALTSLYLFCCACGKCQAQATDPDLTSDDDDDYASS